MPAAAVGILDDGAEAEAAVPYCGECARALIASGEYRVTQVIDAIELGSSCTACRQCGGSGREVTGNGHAAGQIAAARRAVRQVRELVAAFDDVPLTGLTSLFYTHAYEELRLGLDQLLDLLQPGRAGSQVTPEDPSVGLLWLVYDGDTLVSIRLTEADALAERGRLVQQALNDMPDLERDRPGLIEGMITINKARMEF